MTLTAFIESIGLVGPGLSGWPHAADVLAGRAPYAPARTELPPPAGLPSAERRRTGPVVRTALAAGHEAVAASARHAPPGAPVFSPWGGAGPPCHAVCGTLAGDARQLSPTRFHNSVHNAPAGYWSIATRAMATSNVLCAHDGSFAAGLLESLCQVVVDRVPTLLIAYDTDYPEPLRAVRPIDDAFGVALVLAPDASEHALARIDVQLTDTPATTLAHAGLDALRAGNPAARVLPLLEALAARHSTRVVLDYLADTRVQVDVAMPDTFAERA
ncbi:beta-ketoacyl synthase chain length factor [Burkholderia cepacia]|uniref:beta-ketoacyl synthase chain length factor n=1 Tax=Burkholderia cepacia TaxID=292 RepID=UPI001C944CE2|nr:beta-ketoacyl synthase chain length factor [Burkholderia cepacia]MBY4716432.1 beta-ketoacyl synthase chain length factor [Burkholderia cepacia]